MDKEKFLEEIKDNTLEDLEIIYETQKDLYSEEEMEIIKKRINEFKEKAEKEKQEKIKKLLPKEIECPSCFALNSFSNEECISCGCKLDKSKYYTLEYYENKDEDDDDDMNLQGRLLLRVNQNYYVPSQENILVS